MVRLAPALRESSRAMWLGDAVRDVRYTLRMLRRAPAFTALAVATLAVGIGANTAIVSVINAVLLRPLPYPDADRLVRLVDPGVVATRSRAVAPARPGIAVPELLELRAGARTLSHLGVYLLVQKTMAGDAENVRLEGARISAAIVPMLGVNPQLGRAFTADEERAGADAVILLSDAVWQRRFQRDPHIVGRMVLLDGRGYEVVGVMPRDFAFPEASTRPRLVNVPRTDMAQHRVQPGYDASRILTFIVARSPRAADDRQGQRTFAESLVDRLRRSPGVVAAGYAATLPDDELPGRDRAAAHT
jgi:hypothetical protein